MKLYSPVSPNTAALQSCCQKSGSACVVRLSIQPSVLFLWPFALMFDSPTQHSSTKKSPSATIGKFQCIFPVVSGSNPVQFGPFRVTPKDRMLL